MLFDVSLAGIRLPWAAIGGTSLNSWLQSTPWCQGGGIRSARVGGIRSIQLVRDWVDMAVRIADGAATEVEVVDCTAGPGRETSVTEIFSDSLGLELTDEIEMQERLANSLAHRPRVFVLNATGLPAKGLRDIANETEELKALLAKRRAGSRLVVLILGHHGIGDETFELDVAGPALAPLETRAGRFLLSWNTYLHIRIAWETAGDVDRAIEWEPGIARISTGRDDLLEAELNSRAVKTWEQTEEPARMMIVEALRSANGGGDPVSALLDNRLYWRPHGTSIPHPVPWIARALLVKGFPRAFDLLRAAVVCGSLLRNAIGLCLLLEGSARTRFGPPAAGIEPDPEAMQRFAQFRSGYGSDVMLYPKGCPASPLDAWAFSDFGKFLSSLEHLSERSQAVLHELRLLRNALAHGHYVSWSAFERLKQIELALMI